MKRIARDARVPVRLQVNGRQIERWIEPRMLLSDVLREEIGLTGTHVGCEHGICGACTIVVDGEAVRSCLMFAVSAEGAQITTVEGLATALSFPRVQRAFQEHHALQCGFCTPGILASAATEVLGKDLSQDEVVEVLSGHLCRCTGYVGIIEALTELTKPTKEETDV